MIAAPTSVRVHHSALVFDRDYQRAIDPNRVRKLIEKFQATGLGTLTVSMRPDGRRVVVDGQHRVAAVRTLGYEGKLPCNQYTDLTLADEAGMFLLLNNSKQVPALDKFRARVIAREETALAVNAILARNGWSLGAGKQPGQFAAVAAIEKVYDGAGITKDVKRPDLVQTVMQVITDAWGRDSGAAHNFIVAGLGQFYGRFGDKISDDKIVSVMAQTKPAAVIAKAKALQDAQGGTIPAAMGAVLTGLHNKGRRTNRLPEWHWTR